MNDYEFDETAIVTSGDGVGVGKVFHFVQGKYSLHQRAYRIRVQQPTLLPKFVFYFMRNRFHEYMLKAAVRSSVASVRRPMLERFPLPIPTLDEQQRVVTILDSFEALVNDLSIGLPAEIRARREQYEYYRDRLLTFREAA
jgi:type I restriction enzyme, S subunit